MNSHTKQILILSLIILGAALGLGILVASKIQTNGATLEKYTTALSEKHAQEAAFIRVSRLVQETEVERATLGKAFFSDEGDSISFLGDIESFAASVGLTLSTEGLDKITEEGSSAEYITMTFVYSGDKQQVFNFTKYLEDIPYHSRIASLSYRKMQGTEWEGTLTLLISLKTAP
jgi:hypothetical protein